ncbi:MAG: nitroreductase family protein [Actinomycetota bacterium]|nr:nitroreductase family protein [Actinomycetota bacterium]
MPVIEINPDVCKRCFTCTQTCPVLIFAKKDKDSIPEILDDNLQFCLLCGHCAAICPAGAITHEYFPPGSIVPVRKDELPSTEQVIEMLRSRRSIREYKDKPVERELVEKVIDVARCAPSDHNRQSTEFVVVQDRSTLDEIVKLSVAYYESLVEMLQGTAAQGEEKPDFLLELEGFVDILKTGKDLILNDAPLFIAFHAEEGGGFQAENATFSLCYATLAGMALGLGSYFAGFVVMACKTERAIPELLSIPDNHQIYGGLAMGYPKFKYKNWIERKPPKVKWIT